jgi:hypothetical protein
MAKSARKFYIFKAITLNRHHQDKADNILMLHLRFT